MHKICDVHFRPRLSVQSVVLYVSNYSGDRQPGKRPLRAADLDAFAERVFIRQENSRKRLVDDRYTERVLTVTVVNQSSGAKRNAHRAKIIGTHHAKPDVDLRLRFPFDQEAALNARSTQGKMID